MVKRKIDTSIGRHRRLRCSRLLQEQEEEKTKTTEEAKITELYDEMVLPLMTFVLCI
jgi:hypothetical protein